MEQVDCSWSTLTTSAVCWQVTAMLHSLHQSGFDWRQACHGQAASLRSGRRRRADRPSGWWCCWHCGVIQSRKNRSTHCGPREMMSCSTPLDAAGLCNGNQTTSNLWVAKLVPVRLSSSCHRPAHGPFGFRDSSTSASLSRGLSRLIHGVRHF
jgi:hypothetical protein